MRLSRSIFPAVFVLAVCLQPATFSAAQGLPGPSLPPATRTPPASAADMRMSFGPVVRKAAPAVVNVYSRRVERAAVDPFWQMFGGMGLYRQVRIEGHECRTYIHGSRFRDKPWGLFGGKAGGPALFEFSEGVELPAKARAVIRDGQRVRITTPGAGGYGDPLRRDRALVRQDLAEGRITADEARTIYGLDDV